MRPRPRPNRLGGMVSLVLLAPALWSLAAAGQAPATPPAAAAKPPTETLRGCVLRAEPDATASTSVAAFTLRAEAVAGNAAGAAEGAATGAAGGHVSARTYALTTADADLDLARYENRLVEVRGRVWLEGRAEAADRQERVQPGQMQDVGQSATPTRSSASRTDTAAGPRHTVDVEQVRVLRDRCPGV